MFPTYIKSLELNFICYLNNIIVNNVSTRDMKKLEQTIVLIFNENGVLSIKNRNIFTIILAYSFLSISSEYIDRMSTYIEPIFHMVCSPNWKLPSTTDGILVPDGHHTCLLWYVIIAELHAIDQMKNQKNSNEYSNNNNSNCSVVNTQLYSERCMKLLTLLRGDTMATPLELVPSTCNRIKSSFKLIVSSMIHVNILVSNSVLEGPHRMTMWDFVKVLLSTCLLYMNRTNSMMTYFSCQDVQHKCAILLLSKIFRLLRGLLMTSSPPR